MLMDMETKRRHHVLLFILNLNIYSQEFINCINFFQLVFGIGHSFIGQCCAWFTLYHQVNKIKILITIHLATYLAMNVHTLYTLMFHPQS